MSIVVCLATDLLGEKVNFEVDIPEGATLRDVEREAVDVFNKEYARRGAGRRFEAQRWQIYDEAKQKWASLRASNQSLIRPACQIYALQPGWEKEQQAPIPNPTRRPQFTAPLSPQQVSESPERSVRRSVASSLNSHAPSSYFASDGAGVAGRASPPRGLHTSPPRASAHASALRQSRHAAPVANPELPAAPSTVEGLHIREGVRGGRTEGGVHGAGVDALEEAYEQPVTPEGKVAALFHEMNVQGNGVVELEDFRRGLVKLDIPFTPEQVDIVFAKADLNGDGLLCFDEWRQMLAHHPNLRDSLYFRSREYWEDVKLQQDQKSCRDTIELLRERERVTRSAWHASQESLAVQADRAAARQQAVERVAMLVSKREGAAAQALDDVAAMQQLLQELEAEAARKRDTAEQQSKLHSTHAGEVTAAEERFIAAQTALAEKKREEALSQAETAEVKQQADNFRNHTLEVAAAFRLSHEKEREGKESIDQANRDIKDLEEDIVRCEQNLESVHVALKADEVSSAEAGSHIAVASEACHEVGRHLEDVRMQEEQAHRVLLECQRKVEITQESLRRQEETLQALAEQRLLAVKNEQRIIDQEIRLRMQRQALEENEARLRAEHRAVMDVTLGSKHAHA